ncbi:MAG: AsmA family protein [Sulfurimonas sp.]|nr:AsmA family protein [Sulfurimonas sp.]
MFKKIILSLLIIYSLIGFIVVPLLLKPQIIAIVAKETNSKLLIDSIYLNPFIFRLQLDGVVLKSLDDKHLASFSSLEIDFEPLSLIKSALHIKNIILSSPKISLVQNKDKTFNLSTILKNTAHTAQDTTKEKVKIPRIIIDIIKLNILPQENQTTFCKV